MSSDSPSSSSRVESSTPPILPDARLAALGAKTETTRAVERIVPLVVSFALHSALIVVVFLVTWSIVSPQRENEPEVIIADFEMLTYEPLARLNAERAEETKQLVQDRVRTDVSTPTVHDALELDVDPLRVISDAGGRGDLARFAPDLNRATASFVGLSSSNARTIVYVIDASGSMISALSIVLDELARSLDGLTERQRFTVIFFQRNEAVTVPPADQLHKATQSEKLRVLAWIDESVIPAGRSNPIAAIEKALTFRPDVVFLLSQNITGSGEWEIDQRDLLGLLDGLNPRDPATGRRGTQINCVQFLDPDPLDTLRKIAEEHGGERGYKFLDSAELGLRAP